MKHWKEYTPKVTGPGVHSSTRKENKTSMRRKQHVSSQPSGSATTQADEFNFGYFYRTLEEHVNAFAAQEGCPFTLADIAVRVGGLLQDKALREQLRNPELVSQVRADSAGVGLRRADQSGEALYVRPHARRTLSVKARQAIAKAQRARWRKFHVAQAEHKPIREMSAAERREYNRVAKQKTRAAGFKAGERGRQPGFRMKKAQIARMTSGIKNFWAAMTKAERSAEMSRRRAVADAKKAGKLPPPARGTNGAAVAVA
jgi:hypothetical protein